jgi:hypothetical protein
MVGDADTRTHDRDEFLCGLTGILSVPLATEGQPAGKVPRIGLLGGGSASAIPGHKRDGALAHERDRYGMGAHAVARNAAGSAGGAHSFNMTVFGWIGLALVILFIASWTFLEYVTIRGVESVATRAVRRLREWWRRR